MAKKTIITGLLLSSCFIATAFADGSMSRENQIAEACKPYIEQYKDNEDPNKLPAAAQAALKACSDHGSCQLDTLSKIDDCTVRLDNLQPSQVPAVITPPPPKPVKTAPPANPWSLPVASPMPAPAPTTMPSPQTQPASTPAATATQPYNNSAVPTNTNQSPDTTNTSTPKEDKTQPSINWF